MSATVKPSDIKNYLHPEEASKFFADKGRWVFEVNGQRQPDGCDWEAKSPFGSVSEAVVLDKNRKPVFTRPIYREAPNVNCVVWGRGADGIARLAVIRQPRPHADNPENRETNYHEPVIFGQVVMGFLERIIGKDLLVRYESIAQGAARETSEEAGVSVIKNIAYPKCPWHNPNPTFVATWSDLVFIEVNLEKIEALREDRNEPIFSAEYITAKQLRQRIAEGKDERGGRCTVCVLPILCGSFFSVLTRNCFKNKKRDDPTGYPFFYFKTPNLESSCRNFSIESF